MHRNVLLHLGPADVYYKRLQSHGFETVMIVSPGDYDDLDPDAYGTILVVRDPADVREVLAVLTRHNVGEGVCAVYTNNESAVVTAALLAHVLGAKGHSLDSAIACRDKAVIKDRVTAAGVRAAAGATLEMRDAVRGLATFMGEYPSAIKPVDGAGSMGFSVVRSPDQALDHCRVLEERHGSFLIESFQAGDEYHLDGVVSEGIVRFLSVGRYLNPLRTLHSGKTVGGLQLRPHDEPDLFRQANAMAAAVLTAVGAVDGAFHMEAFYHEGVLTFSELGLRVGGGLVVPAVDVAWGVSIYDLAINAVLGLPLPQASEPTAIIGYGMFVLPVGRLVAVPSVSDLQALPGVIRAGISYAEGDLVPEERHSARTDAHVLVSGPTVEFVEDVIRQAELIITEQSRAVRP